MKEPVMHFDGPVWRPPYEATSQLIQVTAGCTWHRCKFCTLYGKQRFSMSPISEIEDDLKVIPQFQPRAHRIFLTGANPFVLTVNRLTDIALPLHWHNSSPLVLESIFLTLSPIASISIQLAAKVFMPPGDFRKSSASLYSLFHSCKLSMAFLICSSKSLAISFCCKDIDSISLNLFSKKLTRITMISKILLMLLCINVTSLFHMSFLVQICSMNSLISPNAPISFGSTNMFLGFAYRLK